VTVDLAHEIDQGNEHQNNQGCIKVGRKGGGTVDLQVFDEISMIEPTQNHRGNDKQPDGLDDLEIFEKNEAIGGCHSFGREPFHQALKPHKGNGQDDREEQENKNRTGHYKQRKEELGNGFHIPECSCGHGVIFWFVSKDTFIN